MYFLFSFCFLVGCQSTADNTAISQDLSGIELDNPKISNRDMAITGLEQQIHIQDKETVLAADGDNFQVPNQKTSTVSDVNLQQASSRLINKQVCREDVKVKYRVTHSNGTKGSYAAKVQAQGIALALSPEGQSIKVKITGWYSENANLRQWQPYLTEVPMAERISLKTNAESWDDTKHWHLCSLH
ncbi:hypothetical protein [Thalassomonas actiniarum]|uniref:Uncharacterized protein n=1 Tax=Thalassomonas actiniarum TaxID=485447 RepID=A0AAE9YX66_9GAMM|nr:hypothetical protein [Thalassomonas actiniarum]WDE02197.1 hypothetical protein SG35_031055 [Thalassomonas actiniarum]